MDSVEIAKAVASLPLTVLLVAVLVGGYLEYWIYGSIHRSRIVELEGQLTQLRLERDAWQRRYLEVMDQNHA